jgi:hypothetical protein
MIVTVPSFPSVFIRLPPSSFLVMLLLLLSCCVPY